MAKPIKRVFESSKKEVINQFPYAAESTSLDFLGGHRRLGLMSFRRHNDPILYAHIVEKEKGTTHVSIAPGLPNLGERGQEELPKSVIEQLLDNLGNIIKNDNK